MKLRVLAVDFDNTIAVNDRLDGDVAVVLREAHSNGVLRVLVTGRILSELLPLLPAPDLFDVIVAKNRAVLQSPNARPIALSRAPDAALVAELSQRGIAHHCGTCIVETSATASPEVLTIVQTLGLPQGVTLNRGRLMVLPHGIGKAGGLSEAIWRLGASLHSTLAIGDAENDQPMLDACEIGVVVAWASNPLKRCADEVIQATGPRAVALYVRDLLSMKTPAVISHPRTWTVEWLELPRPRRACGVRARTKPTAVRLPLGDTGPSIRIGKSDQG